VYTGTVFFEGTNLSEGRGTDKPFQLVGAEWLTDAPVIASVLNARNIPGVRFSSATRTVAEGQKWGGKTIPMIEVTVTDRNAVKPVMIGAWMLAEIYARHGRTAGEFEWRVRHMDQLFGSRRLREAVEANRVAELLPVLEQESAQFVEATRQYWLY